MRGDAIVIVCLAAAMAALQCCSERRDRLPAPLALKIGVGSRGGDFDVMGRALAETLRSEQPAYTVDIVSNEGAVSSLGALQQGSSDCGFSYANVAYEGFVGRLTDEPGPLTRLRGVALIEVTPLYFVVRPGASIHGVRELAGRPVAVGPRGSGSYRAALLVLDAFGVTRKSVQLQNELFRTSADRMRAGTLDAYFMLAGRPASQMSKLGADNAAILPLEGDAIDALRERYPFLHHAVIPAGTYQGQREAIRTVGVESLLLCRDGVEADHVRRVTRDWFRTLNRLAKDGRVTDAVTASLASATPIPLHSGASEYYRAIQIQHP